MGPEEEPRNGKQKGLAPIGQGLGVLFLPGLSVAVGAGGDIVWAEAFGWARLFIAALR